MGLRMTVLRKQNFTTVHFAKRLYHVVNTFMLREEVIITTINAGLDIIKAGLTLNYGLTKVHHNPEYNERS